MPDVQEVEELPFVQHQRQEDHEVAWNPQQLERWNRANTCHSTRPWG